METTRISIGTLDDPIDTLAIHVTERVRHAAAIVWVDGEGCVYCSPLTETEDAIRNDIVGTYDAAELLEDIASDFGHLIAQRADDVRRFQQ
ncbi:MAG: hypothetical protein ABIR62_15595 [Dokdonella sp.]|uniref:hypothetical protein n=1 Tax=Dokdonella sp. TaxID=2291710 RepID=UPI0032635D30